MIGQAGAIVLAALLAGLVNLVVASQELNRRCRLLPFFRPFKSWHLYWFIFVQLAFPAGAFFVIQQSLAKPLPIYAIIVMGIVFGFGFAGAANCKITVADKPIDIKALYGFFEGLAYKGIADREAFRAAKFWTALRGQLATSSDLEKGALLFAEYLDVRTSITEEALTSVQTQLGHMSKAKTSDDRAKLLIPLIKANTYRKDLPEVLRGFSISEHFIGQHFC